MTMGETVDPVAGTPMGIVKREYDEAGNLIKEYPMVGVNIYSYQDNILTISSYGTPFPMDNALLNKKEYGFDDNGNMISYSITAADSSYWNRFTYIYDEQGLPIEKTWSRFELILQAPYELTKYSYEYYE
jgi:hypothetical protein